MVRALEVIAIVAAIAGGAAIVVFLFSRGG